MKRTYFVEFLQYTKKICHDKVLSFINFSYGIIIKAFVNKLTTYTVLVMRCFRYSCIRSTLSMDQL